MTGRVRLTILCLCPIAIAGCLGYPGPRSVENDDPAVKIPAVRRAVEANDRSVIPQLVKDLDSDDAAVRLAAISGLRTLTGGSIAFDWTEEDAAKRFASVRRWANFVNGRPLDEGVQSTTILVAPRAATTRPSTARSTATTSTTSTTSTASTASTTTMRATEK